MLHLEAQASNTEWSGLEVYKLARVRITFEPKQEILYEYMERTHSIPIPQSWAAVKSTQNRLGNAIYGKTSHRNKNSFALRPLQDDADQYIAMSNQISTMHVTQ